MVLGEALEIVEEMFSSHSIERNDFECEACGRTFKHEFLSHESITGSTCHECAEIYS